VAGRNGLLALLAALLIVPLLPASAHALAFERCQPAARIECARVNVPLDPSGGVAGTIGLNVERVPSRGSSRGTLVVLEGGPGGSATASIRDYVDVFGRALADRDLIAIDQRGTGGSGALRCRGLKIPTSLPPVGQADAAARCAASLGRSATLYTTRTSAADIEAVRRALGVDKIALYGASYGTKLELAYALLYPSHVDRLVLDSVVPLDADPFDLESFRALPRVLDELCATGCERITRDPVAATAALVARMREQGALRGPVIDARGRRRTGRIGRVRLMGLLFAGDYDPGLRAAYPAALRSALAGDVAPLLRVASWSERGSKPQPPRVFSDAMHTALSCQEGPLPWDRATAPSNRFAQARARALALPPSLVYPFDRETVLASSEAVHLCVKWPSPGDPPFPEGPLQAVPALVLAGSADLRTPLESAEQVAKAIPGANLVEVPGAGHGVLFSTTSACPFRIVDEFLAGRPASACRPGTSAPDPLPVAPTALGLLPAAPGMPRTVGKTVTAVELTVVDVDDALNSAVYSSKGFAQVGGLRAGYAHDDFPTIRLHGYSYVPGVRLTGLLKGARNQHGVVRVSGRPAARGRLVLHRNGSITGSLGEHRVTDAASARASLSFLRSTHAGR
jgi:pimeloyl-ACP methyl ester carboxylesterase